VQRRAPVALDELPDDGFPAAPGSEPEPGMGLAVSRPPVAAHTVGGELPTRHVLGSIGAAPALWLARTGCAKVSNRVRAAPGRAKVLVVGNHDVTGQGKLRVKVFHRVKAVLTSPGDPLIWTHAPLPKLPAGYLNIHGRQHVALKPADSPHTNVSVEQLDYRQGSLVRIRRLAEALVAGFRPTGSTTLERREAVER